MKVGYCRDSKLQNFSDLFCGMNLLSYFVRFWKNNNRYRTFETQLDLNQHDTIRTYFLKEILSFEELFQHVSG